MTKGIRTKVGLEFTILAT